jgi:hypothetical protein
MTVMISQVQVLHFKLKATFSIGFGPGNGLPPSKYYSTPRFADHAAADPAGPTRDRMQCSGPQSDAPGPPPPGPWHRRPQRSETPSPGVRVWSVAAHVNLPECILLAQACCGPSLGDAGNPPRCAPRRAVTPAAPLVLLCQLEKHAGSRVLPEYTFCSPSLRPAALGRMFCCIQHIIN